MKKEPETYDNPLAPLPHISFSHSVFVCWPLNNSGRGGGRAMEQKIWLLNLTSSSYCQIDLSCSVPSFDRPLRHPSLHYCPPVYVLGKRGQASEKGGGGKLPLTDYWGMSTNITVLLCLSSRSRGERGDTARERREREGWGERQRRRDKEGVPASQPASNIIVVFLLSTWSRREKEENQQ